MSTAAFRMPARRRAAGLAAAFAVEALLVLALLTLGRERTSAPVTPPRTVSFELSLDRSPEPPAPAPKPQAAPSNRQRTPPPPPSQPQPQQPRPATPDPPAQLRPPTVPAQPAPLPPPLVELPRGSLPSVSLPSPPAGPPAARPSRRPAGPPSDSSRDGDTPVVGTAPNGKKLYAASWYREPYDDELRGYLSTAQGPGWALIACRTVPDFRVDDCVAVDEYPTGSQMARAVLAAAWQFRVRPPQLGGQLKVGEWVRIRIDYTRRAG